MSPSIVKRVLLTTFPSAFFHHGGGEREIHLLNEALNSAGAISDIYGPSSLSINAYRDIIHFSVMGGSELMVDAMPTVGHRLILWPNLWFVEKPTAQHLEHLSRFISRFDAVVFKSQAEEDHFRTYLDLSGKDIIRVTPLISQRFFRKDISNVFRDSYGLGRYAIWPGIIEPQKNQLVAVQAFSGLDVDLVISGEVRDTAYAEECYRQAGDNVHFIPAMPFASELHLSALAHSDLFVELPLDFPGTSALEAAAMGCRLLLSESKWTQEMLGGTCEQIDVRSPEAVRTKASRLISNGLPEAGMSYVSMTTAIAQLIEYLR